MFLDAEKVNAKGTKKLSIISFMLTILLVTSMAWSSEKNSQEIDSQITTTLLIDAQKALDEDDYLKTLKLTDMIIGLEPNHTKAHWTKGLALLGLKKFEDSLNEFQIVAEVQPDNQKISNFIKKVKTLMTNSTILNEAYTAYEAENFSHVFHLLEPLAETRDPGAMYILAAMFSKAQGTTQNILKAKELFTESCNRGNLDACQTLGYMYITGKYIKQDKSKAKKLFEKACKNNNTKGCYNLGYMYDKGYGVNKNFSKAKKFYTKACNNGDTKSCNNLKEMPTELASNKEESEIQKTDNTNHIKKKKVTPIKKIPKPSNIKLAQIPPSIPIPQELIPPIEATDAPKGLGVDTPSHDSWPHQEWALKSLDEMFKILNYEKGALHKNKKRKWYYQNQDPYNPSKGTHILKKYNDQEKDRTELEINFRKNKVKRVTYRDDARNRIVLYFLPDSGRLSTVTYRSVNHHLNGPHYKYSDNRTIDSIREHKATAKDDSEMDHGIYIYLNKNGFRQSEKYYNENKKIGTWKKYKNGKLVSMTHYIDGTKKDRVEIKYRDNLLDSIYFSNYSQDKEFRIRYGKGKLESSYSRNGNTKKSADYR